MYRLSPSVLSGCPNGSLVFMYTPGWKGALSKVPCVPRTQHSDPGPGLEPRPLDRGRTR